MNIDNIGIATLADSYIYFGNLLPQEPQYKSGLFHGLALKPRFDRDILHDARSPMPFPDDSIKGFQSQDVFEHIPYQQITTILDDVHRCLRPGGMFRLSVPDYHSPLLRSRSVYDADGNILCDLAMGGQVSAGLTGPIKVTFTGGDGNAHLWFPTYANLTQLILSSNIRKCAQIKIHHAFFDENHYICEPFDQSLMPVSRTPPNDMRANGKPISLVVDFIK
jgi:SAM-dependent methyltransferase